MKPTEELVVLVKTYDLILWLILFLILLFIFLFLFVPPHRPLPRDNVWRFLRRMRRMQKDYAAWRISFDEDSYPNIISWIGHAMQANTHRLRCRLFDRIFFQKATTD